MHLSSCDYTPALSVLQWKRGCRRAGYKLIPGSHFCDVKWNSCKYLVVILLLVFLLQTASFELQLWPRQKAKGRSMCPSCRAWSRLRHSWLTGSPCTFVCCRSVLGQHLAFLPIAQPHGGCRDVKIRAVQSKPPGLPMVTVCHWGATLCWAYFVASSVPFVPKFPDSRAPNTEAGPCSL